MNNDRYLNPLITAKYKLVTDPEDPRLHVVSRKVGQPTGLTAQEVVQALVGYANTMPRCVGLAAPQIGVNKNIIIVRHNNEWIPMINTRITSHSEETIPGPEGCISHSGITCTVDRYRWIKVVATDVHSGKEWRLRVEHNEQLHLAGYYPQLYRVIQHELDHINGTLISDKGYDYQVNMEGMQKQIDAHIEAEEAGPVEVDV